MAGKKQEKKSEQPKPLTIQELQQGIFDRELQWSLECSLRNHIQLIEKAIYQIHVEIKRAEDSYDLNRAAELKYGRLEKLEGHLETANVELAKLKKLLA